MNSGNRRRRGKQCFAIAAIMLLLTGCAAGGASESSAAEETGVISTYEEEQKEPSGGGNTTAPLSQSESVFDLEKRTVLLNSGYEMPVIGLGTWTLSDDEAENSVYHALKSGMRLIDTASFGRSESPIITRRSRSTRCCLLPRSRRRSSRTKTICIIKIQNCRIMFVSTTS